MPEKAKPAETDKLWTISNVITLVRICLVPVFVVALISPWPDWFGFEGISMQSKSLVAAFIFILISCTDWLDGYLARSRGEVTDFGKFMDPLADKILVAAALLALVELDVLPSWPVLIILAREFIVSGIRMVAANKGVVIAASWYGKAKTVTQIIAIVLFIVKDSILPVTPGHELDNPLYVLSWVVMLAALALTIISMMDYFAKARHLLGFGPKDQAQTAAKPDETERGIEAAAKHIVKVATERGLTVATAESLTGGLISGSLTAVPGSSAVVKGAVVSYVNEVKHGVLGVSEENLATYGAVSEQVALQMAEGVREKLGVDMAVSVTGIAGPTGAEPGKPVGTVWIATASDKGANAKVHHFDGSRDEVRESTVLAALQTLEKTMG